METAPQKIQTHQAALVPENSKNKHPLLEVSEAKTQSSNFIVKVKKDNSAGDIFLH